MTKQNINALQSFVEVYRSPADEARAPGLTAAFPLDPHFYMSVYQDVANAGLDPLQHYRLYGKNERRYVSEQHLASDVLAVQESGLLSTVLKSRGARDARGRLIDMFQRGLQPIGGFDDAFIRSYYPRTLVDGENTFAFYCRHATRTWMFPSYSAAVPMATPLRQQDLCNAEYIRETMQLPEDVDPVVFYLTEGFRTGVSPSEGFNTEDYLTDYPDIREAGLNPLLHFLKFGRAEGRQASSVGSVIIKPGARQLRRERLTVLVCTHEMGRSGAPLVALNLVRHLSFQFNVVTLSLGGGEFFEEFSKLSVSVLVSGTRPSEIVGAARLLASKYSFHAAILNSIESCRVLSVLFDNAIPCVSLIHEYAQYTYPFNMMGKTAALSQAMVFPAAGVRDSTLREFSQLGLTSAQPLNLFVRPQGRSTLPPVIIRERPQATPPELIRPVAAGTITVVGAGWVQPRKGVDLFIETAKVLKHGLGVDCRFLWVGANFDPRKDMVTSAYLADQVEASDLSEVVTFVDELSDMSAVWTAADVFFMSSRLDPYPNVALDALAEGLPVVCFEKGTGIADLGKRWPDRVHVAPYNDTRAAAQAIADIGDAYPRKPPPDDLVELLSFESYTKAVVASMQQAVVKRQEVERLASAYLREPTFNAIGVAEQLPKWLLASGFADTAIDVARISASSTLNGLRLAQLPQILSSEQHHANTPPTVRPASDAPLQPFSAILRTDSADDVVALASLAFSQAAIGRIVVVSSTLSELDMSLLLALQSAVQPVLVRTLTEAVNALTRQAGSPVVVIDGPAGAASPPSDEVAVAGATIAANGLDLLLRWRPKADRTVGETDARARWSDRRTSLCDRRLVDSSHVTLRAGSAFAAAVLSGWGERALAHTTLWDALESAARPGLAWSVLDDSLLARGVHYDSLRGREPIYVPARDAR